MSYFELLADFAKNGGNKRPAASAAPERPERQQPAPSISDQKKGGKQTAGTKTYHRATHESVDSSLDKKCTMECVPLATTRSAAFIFLHQ